MAMLKELMEKLEGYGFTDKHGHPLENCVDFMNLIEALPRTLEWTDEPQLGAWNWWRDEDSRIPRYVYQDGTITIAMQIDRVPYQDIGGQWAGPIPEPRETLNS